MTIIYSDSRDQCLNLLVKSDLDSSKADAILQEFWTEFQSSEPESDDLFVDFVNSRQKDLRISDFEYETIVI